MTPLSESDSQNDGSGDNVRIVRIACGWSYFPVICAGGGGVKFRSSAVVVRRNVSRAVTGSIYNNTSIR